MTSVWSNNVVFCFRLIYPLGFRNSLFLYRFGYNLSQRRNSNADSKSKPKFYTRAQSVDLAFLQTGIRGVLLGFEFQRSVFVFGSGAAVFYDVIK